MARHSFYEAGAASCTLLFLSEPLAWMSSLDDVKGSLKCPGSRCDVQLGSWSWSGSQCSCGTWVTPSINLVASKLDRKLVAPTPLRATVAVISESSQSKEAPDAADSLNIERIRIVDCSRAFGVTDGEPDDEATSPEETVEIIGTATDSTLTAKFRRPGRSTYSIHWFVTAPPSAVVILLHDAGASGSSAKSWADDQWGGRLLAETQAAFLFPNSGTSHATGEQVWFDAAASADGQLSGEASESDVLGLVSELERIVLECAKRGTPTHRVFIGGLGHGGSAALIAGLLLGLGPACLELGGVFSLGGALGEDSQLLRALREPSNVGAVLPPVLLCHGRDDPLVSFVDGEKTAKALQVCTEAKFPTTLPDPKASCEDEEFQVGGVEWFVYKGSRHDGGVRKLATWINLCLKTEARSKTIIKSQLPCLD